MTKPIAKRIEQLKASVAVPNEDSSLDELNAFFTPLGYKDRIWALYQVFDLGDVLYTSSFGTKSVFLLHLLKQIKPEQQVHFINTTYHFPETIAYRNQLVEALDLDVSDVLPHAGQNKMTTDEQWWSDHPRMCCTINKIAPIEPIVAKHKVWISGLMSKQTEFRSRLRVFERQGDILKFHPIVDIDEGEFHYHLMYHKLPRHPLEELGYGSIGCTHCTVKGQGREGRWTGTGKTECGLHPTYFNKKEQ